MHTIYVVEDDESIREIVVYALTSAGFSVSGFENGDELFSAVEKSAPSLVLLDIMLPDVDGLTILKRLRNASRTESTPVIMLTARNSEYDKVKGLDMGADDYISKPFGVMELISRVNAVLRRTSSEHGSKTVVAGLTLDDSRREVFALGNKINLTYKEFELLHYLMINAGLALSREKIMQAVWGYDFEGESRTVDMHIKALRQKLGSSSSRIKTVRNVGYMLEK